MRGGDRCYFFCLGNYFIIFYYIANDIACGSNGHRREFNVELALILETENLVNFQCITRVRRTLTSSNGRGSFVLIVVQVYQSLGFSMCIRRHAFFIFRQMRGNRHPNPGAKR